MSVVSIPARASATSRSGSAATSSSITPVAWMANDEIDLAEWTIAGRRLGAMGRCGQWGVGDWLQYGNIRFGERYARAARITGYDVQTLMNMVYVASRFEISRRRENLSWSHHETLASLESDAQDDWLDKAAARRLSVADLRAELRSARLGNSASKSIGKVSQTPKVTTIACPNCGHKISFSQEIQRHK